MNKTSITLALVSGIQYAVAVFAALVAILDAASGHAFTAVLMFLLAVVNAVLATRNLRHARGEN